ncbi:hypothetical protein D3C81_1712680 [compost metagenome]
MANALFCQQRFQFVVGDFIPQRLAFDVVGIDITRARNVIQQIKFRCAPGGFDNFITARRRRRDLFALHQLV